MTTFDNSVRAKLSQEQISALQKQSAEFDDLRRQYGTRPFKPYAYYDEGLDCVRVTIRDCSTCELRINEWLTVLQDNDLESDPAPIGFTLKGVRVLAGQRDEVLNLIELLDACLKQDPKEAIMAWVTMLKKVAHQAKLENVEFSQTA